MESNLTNFIKRLQKEEDTVIEDLSSQVILVTGASHGIGFKLAEVLYRLGGSLVLVSRDIEKNASLKKWDKERILLINGDISNEQNADVIVKKSLQKFGRIDVLVNNAGHFADKLIEESSIKDFDSIINSNLKGTFVMSKSVIPSMKKNKKGLIINIGSKISHNTRVDAKKVLYATAKYAVEGFSYALNRELKSDGIRVVCLMPATVNNFLTLKPKKFLSISDVISVILIVIYFKNVDFEGIVFKSRFQDI